MFREFRLSQPGSGRGVSCDADGAFIGAVPLLKRSSVNGIQKWQPREGRSTKAPEVERPHISSCRATADNWRERALDKALQLIVPVPRKERTHDATSNRISALYGRLYQLDQLNNATVSSNNVVRC